MKCCRIVDVCVSVNSTGVEHHSWLFTVKRDEKTWKVWTAQDPSESVTSWLMWQRHASSASSHTAGWKAAKMAEKNGEGGGGKPRSSKSSTSSRKLSPWRWERYGVKRRFWDLPLQSGFYQNTSHNYMSCKMWMPGSQWWLFFKDSLLYRSQGASQGPGLI